MGAARYGTMSPSSAAPTKRPTPAFPKRQMLVLAMCRICEPIAFMGIFPYIYYMVRDFGVTSDESKISFYAGLITSAFTLAEFTTGVMWGRLSDKIGRKPVLLMGLAGTGLSVLVFGFAPSLPVALLARALGGFLNGNIGVLQTTVAELVTVKEHQPRAYTIMPLVWCLGSVIGPMIGGALAKPVDNFPALFPPGSLWDRFPYLLPNLFSAFMVFFGLVVGILFLEETHAERKLKRDYGLELGKRILAAVPWNRKTTESSDDHYSGTDSDSEAIEDLKEDSETCPLLKSDDAPPSYRTGTSPRIDASTDGPEVRDSLDLERSTKPTTQLSSSRIFTRPVIFNIVSYGILAFHTMTFDALFPIFLSSDPSKQGTPVSLPFQFPAGFAFDTKAIGIILSIQGFYSMFSNLFVVPIVTRRLGALTSFRLLTASYFLLYWITPYVALLPESCRMVGIYALIIWKCTFSTMAYPSNAILLTNSAPSLLSLGTINGVAASTASLCRAFGPTVSGLLYTLGVDSGYSGLVWWFTGFVCIAGAFISWRIPEPRGRMDEKVEGDEEVSEEER